MSKKEKAAGIYLFLLFTIFPLAVHHGYTDILSVKTGVFYLLTGGYILFSIVVFLADKNKKFFEFSSIKLLSAEFFAACFGASVFLSWLCCLDKKAQFFGIYGRNLGFASFLICIVIFFLVSRHLDFSQYLVIGLLGTSSAVSIIALCNHLGFDPFSMYSVFDSGSDFISTMGNLNTLSAYLGLLLPFGMTLFCFSREKASKMIYGIFCFCNFLGMITANSDSAYLMVGMAFVVLLLWGKQKEDGIFLSMLLLEYAAAGLFVIFLRNIRGNAHCMKLRTGIPSILLDIRINLFFAAVSILLLFVFYVGGVWKKDLQKFWGILRKILLTVLLAAVILIILVILFVNLQWDRKEAKDFLGIYYRYLYFSDAWGTKRLRIWRAAWTVYERLPFFRKMIGAGPAGFYSATQAYLTSEELSVFAEQGRLVDAHNVYLQCLTTFGIIGLIFYSGIFLSALKKFLKRGKTEYYMLAFAMLVIVFLVQAIVNNAHIYIEPLVFALTAAGISLCKEKGE